MRCLLLPLLILFSLYGQAQYKSYHISSRGDTLNAIDMQGHKQGKWVVHVDPLRGEPGYEEEGVFENDRKEGVWRRFSLMGDPMALEHYKWGNKNGICRYYTRSGLEREESWRAINPDKAMDTIDVPDPKFPDKYERVVVKNTGMSLKNGTWKYYYPPTGKLLSTETYVLDKLQGPDSTETVQGLEKIQPTDTTKLKTPKKIIPKEVLDFEKKTSGKKRKLRDGSTGG